ncbi:hypothetical protein H5410_014966 [Solanum commersonii]|uniref:Uncharacterized protein n=1 Tax=Solanum commersonii TaxID=4109 RepID=A0A9J5ZSE4_SOLCO|nr:hypothetical protein H5410_014966 [Solanum commersonii]
MIIPEKIEQQDEIQKIEILEFYARKYGRNMTMDTNLIKTRTTANYKSNTKEFYFIRDNDKLLQDY